MNKNIIKFDGYSITKFFMEKKDINDEKKGKLEISCKSFKSEKKEEKNIYKLCLSIVVYTKDAVIELDINGFFKIVDNLEKEVIMDFLGITAPTIIYPYARAFISNVTSFDSGETVVLPVINFADPNIRTKFEE